LILQRVEQSEWLSNAYLVIDEPGGHGVLVDSNGVTDPLSERAEREGTEVTHVVLTHHHWDHVFEMEELAKRFGVPIIAHEKTAELLEGRQVDETFTGGDVIESGSLRIKVIETPGHCADHCALKIGETDVITDRLMGMPHELRVHPGHKQPTTIGTEWEKNPFIRIWRGLDEEGSEPVSIGPADAEEREAATLILWAPDYDGGNKAWVRFEDGSDAVVGGSQVKRES
jgi:hydroxyacylglutathione hydrolase